MTRVLLGLLLLTGCSSATAEFKGAQVELTATEIRTTTTIVVSGFEFELEQAELLSADWSEVRCFYVEALGVRYTPQPLLANPDCLQWLVARTMQTKPSTVNVDWNTIKDVVTTGLGLVRTFIGWPIPDT